MYAYAYVCMLKCISTWPYRWQSEIRCYHQICHGVYGLYMHMYRFAKLVYIHIHIPLYTNLHNLFMCMLALCAHTHTHTHTRTRTHTDTQIHTWVVFADVNAMHFTMCVCTYICTWGSTLDVQVSKSFIYASYICKEMLT